MTKQGSTNAVLLAGGVTLGSVVAGHMLPEALGGKGELPPFRVFIGNGLAFTILSTLTGVAPSLAAWFAALVALNALRMYVLVPNGPLETFFAKDK